MVAKGIADIKSGKIKEIRETLGMETNEFNPYRKRLIRKGIVSGETRGYVYFTLPLFDEYDDVLRRVCDMIEQTGRIPFDMLRPYPSMLFGLETALLSFERGGDQLFDTPFARGEEGIPINGLVWMGNYDEMLARLESKMQEGFRCVKLKIGAIDFDKELDLIRHIRSAFTKEQIELRVDANGG